MSYIGLTLGLLGSFHCILMCGPLVLGVSRTANLSGYRLVQHSIIYNTGRVLAYVLLGVVFAFIGASFSVVGLQKVLSIVTGIFLILLVFASLDIEKVIFKFRATKSIYEGYLQFLSNRMKSMAKHNPGALGFLNGLLPCGMVYVALAGALGATSIYAGALFMLSFGLGTLPVMVAIMIGARWVPGFRRLRLRMAIPIGQAVLGVYLVIRGIGVGLPAGMGF